MSHDSNTIVNKMKLLLTKVNDQHVLIAFGFVREINSKYIPVEIMSYCIVYAFLRINEWIKAGSDWNIDQNKYIAYGQKKYINDSFASFSTVYSNPVISNGKYEWKIKIKLNDSDTHSSFELHGHRFHLFSSVYVGISTSMDFVDSYGFGGNKHKYYAFGKFQSKTSHLVNGSVDYPEGIDSYDKFQFKDVVLMTVHLDMEQRTIAFTINDKFLGVAFDDIDDGDYRLAISVFGRKNKIFEFIQ